MSGESEEGIKMRQLIDNYYMIEVRHMIDSSKYKPKDYESWITYWEAKKPTLKAPDGCACCGKPVASDAFVGSHVVDKQRIEYIYPLCCSCNSECGKGKKEEESPWFGVRKIYLVEFEKSEAIVEEPKEK